MAITNLGKVAVVPRGDFLLGTPYCKLDVVFDAASNSSYMAKLDNKGIALNDTTYWQKNIDGTIISGAIQAHNTGIAHTAEMGKKADKATTLVGYGITDGATTADIREIHQNMQQIYNDFLRALEAHKLEAESHQNLIIDGNKI